VKQPIDKPSVRPLRAADLPAIEAMLGRLSELSVLRRFLGPGPSGPHHELRYLTTVDGCDRFVVVAEAGARIVGMARYHRTQGGHAEMAVVVEDQWQHLGVGRQLSAALAIAARRAGLAAFDVSIMGENNAALGLLRNMAQPVKLHLDHGVFEGTIPLVAPNRAA
jgi:GNAT superfamily N-acetyltransferase